MNRMKHYATESRGGGFIHTYAYSHCTRGEMRGDGRYTVRTLRWHESILYTVPQGFQGRLQTITATSWKSLGANLNAHMSHVKQKPCSGHWACEFVWGTKEQFMDVRREDRAVAQAHTHPLNIYGQCSVICFIKLYGRYAAPKNRPVSVKYEWKCLLDDFCVCVFWVFPQSGSVLSLSKVTLVSMAAA